MSEWCIVAIPAKDDPVWQLSSEKVPHITLINLGDQPDVVKMGQVLYEVASASMEWLSRFGLPVLTRGPLGPKNADVLFFDEQYTEKLQRLRRRLIRSSTIGQMYNAIPQYPKWTPHLTMGYPATPARSSEIPNWINFDRLALWIGDSEGPELTLPTDTRRSSEYDEDSSEAYHSTDVQNILQHAMAMRQAEDSFNSFLEHYGIPGMRWGIRRTDAQLASSKSGGSDGPDDGIEPTASGGGRVSRRDKKRIEKAEETHISADAERFIATHQKSGVEMSTREIREAIARAELIEKYDTMFGSARPDVAMERKYKALDFQKKYDDLHAELNPTMRDRVKKFVTEGGLGYSAYKKLDEATGGAVSDQITSTIKRAAGIKDPPKSRQDEMKEDLESLTLVRDREKVLSDIRNYTTNRPRPTSDGIPGNLSGARLVRNPAAKNKKKKSGTAEVPNISSL